MIMRPCAVTLLSVEVTKCNEVRSEKLIRLSGASSGSYRAMFRLPAQSQTSKP